MEVKPGYKKTEVGLIPEDWHHLNISAFAHVLTGPFGTLLKASEYTEGEGVPLISVGEVREGFFRVDEKTPRVCTLVLKRLPQYALKEGDIVFGRKGGVNRSALVTKKEEGWFLGSDGIRIRPDGNHCHSYLAMQLRSFRVQSWLLQNSIGTTMPSLNQGILCRVQVALPPTLHEQTAIAIALSDVDALLDGLDRLIAKKRDLKQATMQQLLTGQTRLPGFSGEWEVKRLEHAGRCIRGVSYRGDDDLSAHDTDHTNRLLRSNNVQGAVVVTSEVQFVNSARVSTHQVLRKNDILICMANGSKALVGKAGMFTVSDGYAYTFGAFMGCFRTDAAAANPRFVFSVLQTKRYRDYINNILAGSSINNLRPSSIESFEYSFPTRPEQAAIATILSDLDAEIAALEQRRDKTRNIKEAMMQELLTGKTRLVNGGARV